MMDPIVLNKKCSNATASAAGDPVTKDAIKAVKVVPTLAPRIYGNILSNVRIPTPASGTMKDDETELL